VSNGRVNDAFALGVLPLQVKIVTQFAVWFGKMAGLLFVIERYVVRANLKFGLFAGYPECMAHSSVKHCIAKGLEECL